MLTRLQRFFIALSRMTTHLQQALETLIHGMERFGKKMEEFVALLFTGLLEFLETAYEWVVQTTLRIKNYLVRFAKGLARLALALVKLLAFYVPGIICVIVSMVSGNAVWLIIGIAWGVIVTAIGLTYGKSPPSSTGGLDDV